MPTVKQQQAYIELCRRVHVKALRRIKGWNSPAMQVAERVIFRQMLRHPEKYGRLL